MLHVVGYNKDRDVYNELALANNYKQIKPNIPAWQEMLKNEKLKDEAGEPYDWLEVWDDEDDHGTNDIIITVEEVVKREEDVEELSPHFCQVCQAVNMYKYFLIFCAIFLLILLDIGV